MSKADELKSQIEDLPREEFAEIYRWFSQKAWENWDEEIEADSKSGKLNFLIDEAREAKGKGTLRLLPCGQ